MFLTSSGWARRVSFALTAIVAFIAAVPAVHARSTVPSGSTISVRSGIDGFYFLQVAPSSAPTPLTWTWGPDTSGGITPPGLVLDADASRTDYAARVSGIATTPGTYRVKVRADGPSRELYEGAYTFEVVAPSLVLTPASLDAVTVGSRIDVQLALETPSGIALGATSWEVNRSSALPAGVTLDTVTGRLSGTPTEVGMFPFRLYAGSTLTGPSYAYRDYILRVVPALGLRFADASPGSATVGTAYSYQVTALGGTAPRVIRATNPSLLPPGLTLNAAGLLSGTPTAAGTYTFTLKLEDAAGGSVARDVTMTVAAAPAPLAITPSLPFLGGVVRSSYPAQILRATGGRAPYTWSIASGDFPPGLLIDSAEGIVSGTPTTAGTFTFQVRVDDAAGASAFGSYTITIATPSITAPVIPSLPTAPTAPTSPIVTPPVIAPITFPTTPALTARLDVLARLGIGVHALVKLPDDGNRATQADSAVYYIGADGRRHAFSNDKVYFTWYASFAGVRVVSASALAEIPLGANVTYKPGVRLVKFQTDPKVYAVAGRQLRPIASEAIAVSLYGSAWNRQIDDISDAFYTDYQFGSEIRAAADYSVSGSREAVTFPSDALPS